jgi:uncharacterized membrane protein YfcA
VADLPSLAVAISASSIVAVGATVQGAVGFGLSLVAAPVLVLIDPHLVPGPMLFASMVMVGLTIWRDREGIHLAGVGWSVVGRFPGTILGALAIGAISADQMETTIGVIVLLAVAMSYWGPKLRPNPYTLVTAGVLSGFMGTASSIGGPPIAMVYQHESGARLRGTLASFFLIGGVMSLVALRFVGRLGMDELYGAIALLPGILVGFSISSRIAPAIDRGYTRVAVLATATAAAGIILVRQI